MGIFHEWGSSYGDPTVWVSDVIDMAYIECRELRTTPLDITKKRIIQSVLLSDGLEYRCVIGGETVALGSIVEDFNTHVGPVVTLQWLFVKREYRNRGIGKVVLQKLVKMAKERGLPYCYTKRKGDGVYTMRYGGY